MFIELTHADDYPVYVNAERVMWVSPLENGNTRLFMNVADNKGDPAELDVKEDYNEVVKIIESQP